MALLNVDIDLLRTFLTLLQTQSFTRTAQQLLRTQPAISQQISKLEDTVGTKLIIRSRTSIQATAAGMVVKSYAENIIGLNDKMLADLTDKAPPVIRIGIPDDYVGLYLPTILDIAARRFPQTEIVFLNGLSRDLGKRVHDGEIDLAILTADGNGSQLHVLNEQLVWVAKSEYDPTEETGPVKLALFEDGCITRRLALEALQNSQIRFQITYSSDSNGLLAAIIHKKHAIGVMPRCSARFCGLIELETTNLPELPEIGIALMIGKMATPAIQELALAAIDAISPDNKPDPCADLIGTRRPQLSFL